MKMTKKTAAIAVVALGLAFGAVAEVNTTLGLGFPMQFGVVTFEPDTISGYEIKDKIAQAGGFAGQISAYIGGDGSLLSFYAMYGFNWSVSSNNAQAKYNGLKSDRIKSVTTEGMNEFMFGPGFRFYFNDNIQLNLAPGLHMYLENTTTTTDDGDSDTEESTFGFWIGGGVDAQLRFFGHRNLANMVLGLQMSVDGLAAFDSDTMDDWKATGAVFGLKPYLGLGLNF